MTEEERNASAAEYVLGTLSAPERAAFAARIAAERTSAEAVRFWERALAPLSAEVAEVAPSDHLWPRIAGRIDGATVANDRGVSRAWPWAAAAASIAALALAAVDLAQVANRPSSTIAASAPAPTPARGQYIAALNVAGQASALLLTLDPATGAVVAHPVKLEAPARRALELWWIAEGAAPRSVGLLDPARPLRTRVVAASLHGGAFAVSVEPIGGSPTGAPTGPVVYSGALVRTTS
jgi:anti-sigma-K factor RskA